MIFPRGTIRVVSPVTEDGSRIKIDPITEKAVYREDFFPLSAKRAFEEQNAKLPAHLRKKIEVLQDQPIPQKSVAEPGEQADIIAPERKKPGPKPKNNVEAN